MIKQRIEDAEFALVTQRAKLEEWTQMYNGVLKEKTFPWKGCSNVDLRLGTIAIETIVPRIIKSIHEVKPVARIIPRKVGMGVTADIWEDFLDWSLETEFRNSGQSYLEVKEDVYRACCRDGTAIEKVYWKTLTNTIRTKEQTEIFPGVYEEREIVSEERVYDAPVVDLVDLKDIVVPPNARHLQRSGSQFVAHKFRISPSDLKRKAKEGIYDKSAVNKIIKAHNELVDDNLDTIRKEIQGITDISNNDEIELYEYWGQYDLDGDGLEEECQIVIHLDTDTICYKDFNPFEHGKRPFVCYRFIPRDGMFFGMGIMELVQQHSKAINTLFNQLIDNNTLTNMPIFKVVSRNGVKELDFFPGARWPVWQTTDIDPLMQINTVQFDIMVLNLILGFIQKLTGSTDFAMGQTSAVSENRTARGIMSIIQEGNSRFDLIIKRAQDQNAEEWKQILQLNAQYRDPVIFPRVTGDQQSPQVVQLDRSMIQNQPDVYPQGNLVSSNKFLEADTWTEILQQLGNDQSGDVDTRKIKYKYLAAKGMKDVNGVINPPQQSDMVTKLQQQLQKMGQQLQQISMQKNQLEQRYIESERKRKIDVDVAHADKEIAVEKEKVKNALGYGNS